MCSRLHYCFLSVLSMPIPLQCITMYSRSSGACRKCRFARHVRQGGAVQKKEYLTGPHTPDWTSTLAIISSEWDLVDPDLPMDRSVAMVIEICANFSPPFTKEDNLGGRLPFDYRRLATVESLEKEIVCSCTRKTLAH